MGSIWTLWVVYSSNKVQIGIEASDEAYYVEFDRLHIERCM